jgi:activating signal cointegrator 1
MGTLFDEMVDKKYKVLTLWQPWASLLIYGFKKIETRPAFTNWTIEKGIYLIHAARKWTSELDSISKQTPFKEALKGLPLTLGCIIGSIEVIECTPIMEDNEGNVSLINNKTLSVMEIDFGDYREGRYAWICSNPRILKNPIPYKNGQGYYQNYKGDLSLLNFK